MSIATTSGERRVPRWTRALIEDGRLGRALLVLFVIGLATSITLAQSALAVLTIRWLGRLAARSDAPRAWPLAGPFIAWVGISLLTALLSARPLGSLTESKDLLLIVAFYVLLESCRDAGAADRLLRALLAAMTLAAVLGILQVTLCSHGSLAPSLLMGFGTKCHRARGFYSISLTFGGADSLVLLAALPRLLLPAPRRPAWPIAAWLVGFVAFVLARVRGAWLGFLAGVLVQAPLVRRHRVVLIGAITILVAASLLIPSVRERAATIGDPSFHSSLDRLQMWETGLAMFLDHPIVGVGPGQVKHLYPLYQRTPGALRYRTGHVHSTPLQILVERGILGFGAWVWLFVAFFARSLRLLRRLPAGAGVDRALVIGGVGSIAGFLVGGLTEYNFGDSEVVMIAYCVMALPFAVGLARQRTPQ
jgi:putative inorganic carbon (HCO3(-)) transporter